MDDDNQYPRVSPGSPGDTEEITPGQQPPVHHRSSGSGHPPTTAPAEGLPPTYDSLLDVELAKSLIEEYKKSLSGKKDRHGKAKGRSAPVQEPSPRLPRVSPSAAAPATATAVPLQGGQYGPVPPQHLINPQPAGWFPPPPHQWAPGGSYGGIQGAPQRFPNPYAMQHQQHIAHPWYSSWPMQLNNNDYGAPYTTVPQQGPSYG